MSALKTLVRVALLAAAFCLPGLPAQAQVFPTNWYWVVADTNPTTQVFQSSSGTFVSNTTAAYNTWLANCNAGGYDPLCAGLTAAITGAADNGSGLCRLTTSVPGNWNTGDIKTVEGIVGATNCNGAWTITVVNPTTIDLQSSAISGQTYTSGGVIGSGPPSSTAAALYQGINNYNVGQWNNSSGSFTSSTLASTTLTNPVRPFITITYSAGNATLTMPKQDLFGSIPLGIPITVLFNGSGANHLTIYEADGSTIIGIVYGAGDEITFTPTFNTTTNGGWAILNYTFAWQLPSAGGSGQILTAQGSNANPAWETLSQDCTITNAGVITCTKTNNVAFAASATTDTTNAGNISSGTLGAARLPNPSATTLGGVKSYAAVSHQWINTISTAGAPSSTQPACGDLSNSAASCSTDATNAGNISSGTLAVARGGTGDTGTAWSTYSPVIGCNSGSVSGYTIQVGRYKTLGKTVWVTMTVEASAVGTCSGATTYSLPVTANSTSNDYQILSARDASVTNQVISSTVLPGTSTASAVSASSGNITATDLVVMTGVYESN